MIDAFRRSPMPRAKRRSPASSATSASSSRTFSTRRATSAPTSSPPATMSPAGRPADGRALFRPRTPTATRAISCSRRPSAQLEILRFPLGDMTKPQTRLGGRAPRPAGGDASRTARTSASCPRALCRGDRAPEAGCRAAGRNRPCRRARARPPRRHGPFHRRPAQGPRHRRRRAALRGAARCRAGQVIVGPREALATRTSRAARRELARRRRHRPTPAEGWRSRCACARRGRPQPARCDPRRRGP